MATEEKKNEVVKTSKTEKSYILLKDFNTEAKHYKKGEQYSHSNKKVIEYLKTNKII